MMKNKSTKRALVLSALSLLLCVSMLIGSTYAWFTDSVTSAGNIIKSGTLDVTMEWADGKNDPTTTAWTDASTGAIFNYDLWEPGYTTVRHIKIANEGTLALKYQLNILANGEVSKLAEVIDVYYVDPAAQIDERTDLTDGMKIGTLAKVLKNISTSASGNLLPNEAHTITLALKMQESAGNEYQGLSIGSDFSVQLLATQLTAESDSFGDQYDKDAAYTVGVETVDDLAKALKAGNNVVLNDDIALTGTLVANKDVIIDLNGNEMTAPSSGAMFQSQSNASPDIMITSSVAGAEINVTGGDTGVLLGYGSTVINNVTINVTGCDNYSPNPFKAYGDLTLGKGTVVNVDKLGTSLISNNGAVAIVIDGAKINIDEFKTNGTAVISLNNATTLKIKDTDIKIGKFVLSAFGGDSLVSKVDGVTIENTTFDVTDSNGASCTFEAKDGKYRLVQE